MGLNVGKPKPPEGEFDELDLGVRSKPIPYLTGRDLYGKYREAMEDQGIETDPWEYLSRREKSSWHSLTCWVKSGP